MPPADLQFNPPLANDIVIKCQRAHNYMTGRLKLKQGQAAIKAGVSPATFCRYVIEGLNIVRTFINTLPFAHTIDI